MGRVDRLTGRRFTEAMSRGRRASSGVLRGFALQGDGSDTVSLGFSVPRKVGRAVERNRIRRRLREIVRGSSPKMQPGIRLVIAVTGRTEGGYGELAEDVGRILQKLGLIDMEESVR